MTSIDPDSDCLLISSRNGVYMMMKISLIFCSQNSNILTEAFTSLFKLC